MDPARSRRFERSHDAARVVALSDGVFAIIITLLVLEIRVPDLSHGQRLAAALNEIRPSLVAFLISFFVVAIAWSGHRDLFAFLRLTDRNLVWLNVVYMLPLSLLPFGAALISRFPREGVALRLYGLLLLTIALTRLMVWLDATNRPHLMFGLVDRRSRRRGVLVVALPSALYVFRDPHRGQHADGEPVDLCGRSHPVFHHVDSRTGGRSPGRRGTRLDRSPRYPSRGSTSKGPSNTVTNRHAVSPAGACLIASPAGR